MYIPVEDNKTHIFKTELNLQPNQFVIKRNPITSPNQHNHIHISNENKLSDSFLLTSNHFYNNTCINNSQYKIRNVHTNMNSIKTVIKRKYFIIVTPELNTISQKNISYLKEIYESSIDYNKFTNELNITYQLSNSNKQVRENDKLEKNKIKLKNGNHMKKLLIQNKNVHIINFDDDINQIQNAQFEYIAQNTENKKKQLKNNTIEQFNNHIKFLPTNKKIILANQRKNESINKINYLNKKNNKLVWKTNNIQKNRSNYNKNHNKINISVKPMFSIRNNVNKEDFAKDIKDNLFFDTSNDKKSKFFTAFPILLNITVFRSNFNVNEKNLNLYSLYNNDHVENVFKNNNLKLNSNSSKLNINNKIGNHETNTKNLLYDINSESNFNHEGIKIREYNTIMNKYNKKNKDYKSLESNLSIIENLNYNYGNSQFNKSKNANRVIDTLISFRQNVTSNNLNYLNLELKDVTQQIELHSEKFSFTKRATNLDNEMRIISMSLYGSDKKYLRGALVNAVLIKKNFPSWRLRFYTEQPSSGNSKYGKLSSKLIEKLLALGTDIHYIEPSEDFLPPMMWRFLVADDPSVDRFLIRDVDSRLTKRDALAVEEWIKSGKPFNCIRDHPSHTQYSISGGLWGGVTKDLRDFLRRSWIDVMRGLSNQYFTDMSFLQGFLWPRVKNQAYCSDSVSCDKWPNSFPFPIIRYGYEHVGQVFDERDIGRRSDERILRIKGENANCMTKTDY